MEDAFGQILAPGNFLGGYLKDDIGKRASIGGHEVVAGRGKTLDGGREIQGDG